VTTGDGAAVVVLPANALSAAGTLVVRPVPADVAPPAGAGFALLGKTIEITLFDVQGNPIAHPSFANPIQVCFAYTADDLAKAGGTADALVVQFYDTSASKWVTLPTALDASSSRMCGSVTHFSLFSLAARSSAPRALPPTSAADLPSSLPKTSASAATAVPAWIWAVSALALAVGGALTLRFRQMKRK